MRTVYAATLAALAATLSVPAVADDTVTVRVDIADIDFTAPDARERLVRVIEVSAREACTVDTPSRYIFHRKTVDRSCVAEVRQAALTEAERVIAARTRAGRTVAAR